MIIRLSAMVLVAFLAQAQSPPKEFHKREAAIPGGETLRYLVYEPRDLKADRRYPLVIYLHGSCGECTTHERIMRESGLQVWHGYERNEQREPTFLFAPAGGTGGWTREPRRGKIFEIIDGLLAEYPIDRRRIYILGFSMGAAGTWNYIQERPGFFAAANPQAIGGGTVDAAKVKDIPIWATIGVDDDASRIEQLTANVARIRAANGDPRGASTLVTGVNPRFTIFAATNHGGAQTRTQQMPGFLDWFYAQVNDGNIPPNVRFIRPVPSPDSYHTAVGATVSAVDPDGTIDRVEFYLDNIQVGVDREAPYEYSFGGLAEGQRTLEARGVDAGGKSRTARVDILVRGAN
jgi:poly(3-hydroxybutyrate) depolymerase